MNLSLSSIRASLYRDSLPEFIRAAWKYYPQAPAADPTADTLASRTRGGADGRGTLQWGRHLDVLCDVLMGISAGRLPKRWVIRVPPGTSKSTIVNVMWPAWEWIVNPGYRYISVAYAPDNTNRDNDACKAIVQSDWYMELFWTKAARARLQLPAVDVAIAVNKTEKFTNTMGGYRIASSLGGAILGEHPNRIILDDLLKAQVARSRKVRQTVHDFLDFTLPTRTRLDPAIICVGQNLHKDGPDEHLLAKGGWLSLCLPMRYEPPYLDPADQEHKRMIEPDPRDWRTRKGQLLWPEVMTEEKVRALEIELGPYGTAAQLQQHAIPLSGGLFKREYFSTFVDRHQVPIRVRKCRGWDTSTGRSKDPNKQADPSASVHIAMANDPKVHPRFYVLDCFVDDGPERLIDTKLDEVMHQLAELDGRGTMIREEREPASGGDFVVRYRKRNFTGYNYMWVPVTTDKVTKSGAFRSECQAGNVALVRGPWNSKFVELLCAWTGDDDDVDDVVDAASTAFNVLAIEGPRQGGVVW